MSNKSLFGLIVLLAAVIVGWNSFFVVAQTERAIVLQFGKVVENDVPPGLHFKLPFVQEAQAFDGRLLTLDTATQRYLTLEKKALMVDSYAKWRIADVQRFYTATSGLAPLPKSVCRASWSPVCATRWLVVPCMRWCLVSAIS